MEGIAAGVVLVALAAWVFGSGIARAAGGLLAIIALVRIAAGHESPRMWMFLAVGAGLWLFGHWLWAAKHKLWRSRLALSIFSTPLLDRLAPIPTNRIRRQPRPGRRWVQPRSGTL